MTEAICSGCQRAPHPGGCRVAFSQPPPPSAEELQRRRDYLASPEFKHLSDSSLAGRNPYPVAEALPGATTALRERDGAIAERDAARDFANATRKALAAARLECDAAKDAYAYCLHMFPREWLTDPKNRNIFAAVVFKMLDEALGAPAAAALCPHGFATGGGTICLLCDPPAVGAGSANG